MIHYGHLIKKLSNYDKVTALTSLGVVPCMSCVPNPYTSYSVTKIPEKWVAIKLSRYKRPLSIYSEYSAKFQNAISIIPYCL